MSKVLDLFAGVGGMSLGAVRAGFSLVGAVEIDSHAVITHKLNFPNTQHFQEDIAKLKGSRLKQALNLAEGELAGIIGGPPCQGFSTMGKGDINDPRNSLFMHYFRLIKELKPEFFVAENVPGILNPKYDNIRENAFNSIKSKYHILPPIVINASDLGAPTIRKRVFFVGFKKKGNLHLETSDFIIDDIKYNYIKDAFFGLPMEVNFDEHLWTKVKKTNLYTNRISSIVKGNLVGDPYSVDRFFTKHEISGMIGTQHTPEIIARFQQLNQGNQDKVSKSIRLRWDGFSPTLRAGTGSDKGSFQAVRPIHPFEPRVITPREAARIQGFPDWFQFHKTKWHSFRQIGNSVSPLVSEFILSVIYRKMEKSN